MPLEVPRHGRWPASHGRRFGLVVGLALAVGAAGWCAAPRRFTVDGVSMGPGLLPGDVVRTGLFPAFDPLRRPRRFDRWVLAAVDGLAVKRLVGLPGEEIALVDGDLEINREIVLEGPRLLAELGSRVPDDAAAESAPADSGWEWSRPAHEVLDDAAFDPETTRVLAAVGDVGLAAVVDVHEQAAADPASIRVRVGDTVVTPPLAGSGRHAVVAGRLDGRLVVAVWPMPAHGASIAPRQCLPAGAPEAWQTSEPWSAPAALDSAPALAIDSGDRARLVEVWRWRDVAWRPGADGRARWQLGADEVFVLGDHPAASTDSRRWGPVATTSLRHRVAARAGR